MSTSQPNHSHNLMAFSVAHSLQYEEVRILLYRPFLGSDTVEGFEREQSGLNGSVARHECFEAASSVCALLASCRRQYGLKRVHVQMVHVTLTAALILAYRCCTLGGRDARTAQELLLICMQALGEMGQTYRSASRALEVVTTLRNEWRSTACAAGRGKKRMAIDDDQL